MKVITNAHTHLELTGLANLCPQRQEKYVPWLRRLVWHQQRLSKEQIHASIEQSITELKACETTHIGDITSTGQSVDPLLKSGLQGIVYLEVRGRDRKDALQKLEKTKIAILKAREHPNYGYMQVGLGLHAPYSCHPDLLRESAAWCRVKGVPLCIHVAESPVETKLLLQCRASSASRPMRLLVKLLSLWSSFLPLMRPIPYLASLSVVDARPSLVHAIQVTEEDIRTIANAGCTVVHCPRSNVRLSCGRMPLERYLAAGIPVYLGTDSRASSPSLDVRDEARFAQSLHSGLVDSEKVAELINRPFP